MARLPREIGVEASRHTQTQAHVARDCPSGGRDSGFDPPGSRSLKNYAGRHIDRIDRSDESDSSSAGISVYAIIG